MWQWRTVFDAATKAQSANALGQAFLLVGKERVLRVDAPESRKPIDLDDYATAREQLPEMARSLAEAAGREVQRMFLVSEATAYQPQPI
jgi:hypothetical protein